MTVLTLAEAEDLAARTLAAIGKQEAILWQPEGYARYITDRERVASDLQGLRDSLAYIRLGETGAHPYYARRFSDNLRRTADLYGIQS